MAYRDPPPAGATCVDGGWRGRLACRFGRHHAALRTVRGLHELPSAPPPAGRSCLVLCLHGGHTGATVCCRRCGARLGDDIATSADTDELRAYARAHAIDGEVLILLRRYG